MDRNLIERYADGADAMFKAIEGLSQNELNAHPGPGEWSIRQIVLHMMDSDLIGADRMKRVAAEDHPTLIGYNETLFANTLYGDDLDVTLASDIFAKNRRMTAAMLRRLPDASFARTGYHNEHGDMTLEHFLTNYIGHLDHHMRFVREKRMALGKPLA
jgi:uncharacterized damage-inducible protein DinB